MDELYLDNIDEFVNDHNKIVTYKWLSLTLGVHVNVAKQMLYHYLDHKRKESSAQLHATYLVSGKLVENGQTSHRVSVVREEQLEDVKSKMSVTVSVHVYSVQKAGLKDSGPLYSVDYDAVKNNLKNCSRYSAIRCAGAVPMSSAEVQQVREMERAVVPEPQNAKTAMNGHASVASKPPTKPPKGIMGMFASKPAPKNEDAGKEIKLEPKESAAVVDAPKTKPTTKTNPMAKFFGNQAAKRPEKTVKEEEAAPSSSSVEQRASSSRAEEIQEAVPVEQPREAKKESRSKTKRVEDSDSEEEKMEKKKRRRIKKPEPDSSDDEVIPDSPQRHEAREPLPRSDGEEMTSASRPQQESSGIKTRKRRRVLKSRTFVDEEGCIVTEKGYESESYSETEDDVQAARSAPRDPIPAKIPASRKEDEKPTKSQKKAAASANKGTKQASIMGFFQKK